LPDGATQAAELTESEAKVYIARGLITPRPEAVEPLPPPADPAAPVEPTPPAPVYPVVTAHSATAAVVERQSSLIPPDRPDTPDLAPGKKKVRFNVV
jgi:hypothetical protein